jgi:hypothetical protein
MMRRIWVLISILILSGPAIVLAQDVPRAQVAGGFADLGSPNAVLVAAISDEDGTAKGPGWFTEIIGNITPHVGMVGHLSATHTTGTLNSRAWAGKDRAYTVLGGPRFSSRCCQSVIPFAQVLLGFVHSTADITEHSNPTENPRPVTTFTTNWYAFTAGGGADIHAGGPVGIHLGADLMRTNSDLRGDGFTLTWRIQAGLIVPMR